jgi:hypothetical protein
MTLRAVVWRRKLDVHLLKNMTTQENSNVCKKHESAIKPEIRQVYAYVDKVDRMVNSYLKQSWTWKRTTVCLILRLDIPNNFLSQTSCGSKTTGGDLNNPLCGTSFIWWDI